MGKKKRVAKKRATGEVNKKAAIEEYLVRHPTASPAEIVTALQGQGIVVSPNYVSDIKSKLKKQRTKRRRQSEKPAHETTPVQDVMHASELMLQAVDLVMKAGYKEAKSMVEVAGKVIDRIREK